MRAQVSKKDVYEDGILADDVAETTMLVPTIPAQADGQATLGRLAHANPSFTGSTPLAKMNGVLLVAFLTAIASPLGTLYCNSSVDCITTTVYGFQVETSQ